jgi:hypothetical protein
VVSIQNLLQRDHVLKILFSVDGLSRGKWMDHEALTPSICLSINEFIAEWAIRRWDLFG